MTGTARGIEGADRAGEARAKTAHCGDARRQDGLPALRDFAPLIGEAAVERILEKARALLPLHVCHVNSTYYGGGVAELLSTLTLLMNDVGIRTGWRVLQGSPDFFSVTKKIHNGLQGGSIRWTDRKRHIYEQVVSRNAARNHLDHDMVIIHDPQPLPLVEKYRHRGPWIWRCHVDMSGPDRQTWDYLRPYVNRFDAAIFHLPEYGQQLDIPQRFFMPGIDPFDLKNRELTEDEMSERLERYGIPTDLPLVVQVSRFDPWKDPEGVLEAFRLAREHVKARLVLLGSVATDDPEGREVFQRLMGERSDEVFILSQQDSALVNTLQRKAAVVLQKSRREGFGLTVTEAMFKGAAVIGGNAGGIRHQIEDGKNGFLVSSVEEAGQRIAELVKTPDLRTRLGAEARKTASRRFLISRLLEDYLDLFAGFKPRFVLNGPPARPAPARGGMQ